MHKNVHVLKFKIKNKINKIKSKTLFMYIICMSLALTYWTVTINITLIIISNISILNPGPNNDKLTSGFSVLYHNVRGFMSYNPKLPNSPPVLNTTKVLEFQSYIFQNKPDIVVVNETWLNKSINSNEILPNKSYIVISIKP